MKIEHEVLVLTPHLGTALNWPLYGKQLTCKNLDKGAVLLLYYKSPENRTAIEEKGFPTQPRLLNFLFSAEDTIVALKQNNFSPLIYYTKWTASGHKVLLSTNNTKIVT